MAPINFQLGDLHRRRAELLGDEGQAWIDGLPELINELESRWRISVQSQLEGGTEALVLRAVNQADEPVVLKLGQPGSLGTERRALELADGVGYAVLLASDRENEALLLEGLGEKLADSRLSVDEQLRIICRTVQDAWRAVPDPEGLMTGAEKARWHGEWMETQWQAQGEPCSRALIDLGLCYADERQSVFDPDTSVLVHGDAHAWNTLAVPGEAGSYKLVDPDGLFMEPAYDLGISLREWMDELLAGDALSVGRARAELLSELTGVPDRGIWQWGYIEHVSSALLYGQLKSPELAEPHFRIADRWAED